MNRVQLLKALNDNQYIAARWYDGMVTGINSKVVLRGKERFKVPVDKTETRIASYYPISFQEYIRIKIPFL
jgi:hypothetical protein